MVWEGIIIRSQDKKNNENIINALLSLFCIKYKPSCNRSRKYLIYLTLVFYRRSKLYKSINKK